MPSQFAEIVLFSWPLVVYFLFKRLPLQEALAWAVVAGYLLLPNIVGFDLPLVPPFDKELTINLSAAVMCVATGLATSRHRGAGSRRSPSRSEPDEDVPADAFVVRRGTIIFWSLLTIMFTATLITTLNNSEPLVRGTRFLSGMKMYDVLSINMALLINITPFLLARRYLATPEAHIAILKIFVLACLCYSVLALWELRMSPQLNKQIYGFGPHQWSQHVRGGSYRPIIFMSHGLWLAIIFAMSALAAMAIWREKLKSSDSGKWLLASLYLFVIVFMCNSLGAFVITVLLLPLVFMFGVGLQLFLAAIVSGTILLYPMLRGAGLVPTEAIYNIAASIDEKRAASLLYRFENEDELLAHANNKPLAGWGTWGRNRVFNEKGGDIAATDGFWIIIVGVYGWLGYIAQFGLLGVSTILLAMNRKRLQLTAATSGIAVVMAGALIDLIPNATTSPVLWLFAGALMGRYQTAVAVTKETNVRKAAAKETDTSEEDRQPATARRSESEVQKRPLHQRRPREG